MVEITIELIKDLNTMFEMKVTNVSKKLNKEECKTLAFNSILVLEEFKENLFDTNKVTMETIEFILKFKEYLENTLNCDCGIKEICDKFQKNSDSNDTICDLFGD